MALDINFKKSSSGIYFNKSIKKFVPLKYTCRMYLLPQICTYSAYWVSEWVTQ
jgi:hypothetical protein